MIEIGRVCLKTVGREAGKICVIVDIIDKNYVLIDGEVRRKKCNITHLEPLDKKVEIRGRASHAEVVEKFKEIGIEIKEKKSKSKKERPKKVRKREKLLQEEGKEKEKNKRVK